jgi:hypothetical protein
MSLNKQSRKGVGPEVIVPLLLTTIVVLATLIVFSASQNIVIALATSVLAVVAVMTLMRDSSM